ncbi:MAG TPA: hypothetical protein VIH18_35450 [Candidatus Binatia bacterium]|jgi:hypothetical protein
MAERAKTIRLRVAANLLESKGAEKVPKGAAYAFSSGGRFLSRAALDEKGNATLSFPAAKEAQSVRVLVGPEIDEKEPSILLLQRRGAEERHLRIDPNELTPAIEVAIIPQKWLCWLLGLCFVRGTLLKRVVSGGVTIDLPVCNATVEVYEVDPLFVIIPRLPDLIIERIRDVIINPPPPPPPPEERFKRFPPPPPPDDLFGPIFPPTPGPVRAEFRSLETASVARRSAANISSGEIPRQAMSSATDLQFLARTTDTLQFRQVLIDHASIIRHILCLFLPPLVTTSLVATATTDECGHFQTFFFRGCSNPDQPDLYFKAKQRLFGFFNVTIYAPAPIPCFTYWNYVCGTEVTLYTTNPLAVTCSPCPPVIAPNNWVLVMAIGNYPLSRIRGTGEGLQPTTGATNLGLTESDAPWGGLLRPRVEFDNSLRESLNVNYYQVSWRKGASGAFTPLTGEVHRHYAHMVGSDLVLTPYVLGPQTVNGVPNLFEIPPALPPLGQWSIPDAVENTTSAKFPTATLAPAAEHGKYQLKLDLFDINGAPVNIAAKGIKYVIPTSTDLSGTINTEDANLLGLVSGNSFIMTLHLDNNPCNDAVIDAPTLNGNAAGDDCGVLDYDPAAAGSVVMQWKASHPNGLGSDGFATYSFALYRGVNLLTIPPALPTLPASGRAMIGPGGFSNTQLVSDLLGSCTVAGFSENLYVAAMAIDGWRRLSEYDRSGVRAFVLSPQGAP